MNHFTPGRPEKDEYLEYFETYISLVDEEDIIGVLGAQTVEVEDLVGSLTTDQSDVLHEPYTWTIKQVIGHCNDTERIFGYRACRFSVGDQVSLPGFDQDIYVANTDYSNVAMADLLSEFKALRESNVAMFKRLTPEAWARSGIADGKNLSVRAAAYIMAGHIRHHARIITKRLS